MLTSEYDRNREYDQPIYPSWKLRWSDTKVMIRSLELKQH